MANGDRIAAQTVETQRRIGRLAARDHGLTIKQISMDSGIPYNTARSYFSQAKDFPLSELPISAFVKLCGVIPDELLSQLLAPGDRHIEPDEEDEDTEFDDLAERASEVERTVRKARRPDSPGGTEIIAVEEQEIRQVSRGLGRKEARLRIVA